MSRGFLDLATLDARSTHANALGSALHDGPDELQVQIPTTVGHIVGMTDSMSKLRTAPTYFTHFGHK